LTRLRPALRPADRAARPAGKRSARPGEHAGTRFSHRERASGARPRRPCL